ncbi:MAG: hypothetical protein AB1640_04155 [bacterium]
MHDKKSRPLAFLVAASVLLVPLALDAAWTVGKIAQDATGAVLEGDLIAYREADDIVLYRISTGAYLPLTQDGSAARDEALGMDERWLWFSSAGGDGSVRLRLYDRSNGSIRDLLAAEDFISWSGAADGVALLEIDEDWWLCGADGQQPATQSGSAIYKYQAMRSGNFLIWTGQWRDVSDYRWVFRSISSPPAFMPIASGNRHHGSLRGDGDYAAWVAYPEPPATLQEIWLYRVSTLELTRVGTSQETCRADILDVKYPWLIWVKKEGAWWQLMQYNVDTGGSAVLMSSSLRMLEPVLAEGRILYTTHNCPDAACEELNVYDLSTRTRRRLTTSGYTHRLQTVSTEANRIVWSDSSWFAGSDVFMAVGP